MREAEATPEFRPIDSQPVKVQASNTRIRVLEPYVCVELVELARIVLVPGIQHPRDLNETRLGFVHGEEDGIEGVGTSSLDLEAVLFM